MQDKVSQINKFRQAAQDLEVDQSENALDKIMDRLDLKAKPKPKHVNPQHKERDDG